MTTQLQGILGFKTFLVVCFLSGLALGTIVAPFYAAKYILDFNLLKFVMSLLLIPLANSIFVAIYGLVGYPLYKYLAKKGIWGLNQIEMEEVKE